MYDISRDARHNRASTRRNPSNFLILHVREEKSRRFLRRPYQSSFQILDGKMREEDMSRENLDIG